MTLPKLITGGVALALAVGVGAFTALSLDHDPAPTAPAGVNAPTRAVSDDSTARQIYDGAKNAVAYVSAATPEGQATGSGFVVSPGGLVVTNHHVVEGANELSVVVGTGKQPRPAQLVADDPSQDLALLQVDTGGAQLPTLSLGDSSKVGVGDATYAIGSPFGLDNTLTSGIVSALGRELQAPNGATISGAIQTDAAINPGNSGGPLLDEQGKVIGVNSQIAAGSQGGGSVGVGFAVPSNTVEEFLAAAKSGDAQPQAEPQQADPYAVPQEQADPYAVPEEQDPYGVPQEQDPGGALIG
jgi:putative serine protease PepD